MDNLNEIKKRNNRAALTVCRIAVMAASLTAFKLALSFMPNIEVVTLLILVYSTVFGARDTLLAVIVFCSVEIGIYGVGTWILLYFIYFPLLAAVSSAFLKKPKISAAVIIAAVGSILFGLLAAASDTVFMVAGLSSADLWKYFIAYYIRGLYFDLIHTVSNVIVVAALYKPMTEAVKRAVKR